MGAGMSESAILAAFYRNNRFCELTAYDMHARSGFRPNHPFCQSLLQRGMIRSQSGFYRLSPSGERRVSEMIAMGTLPKAARVLTATPQGGAA